MALSRDDFVQFLRTQVSDRPEFNTLLSSEELTDNVIEQSLQLAEVDYNMTPPATSYNVETHPAQGILAWGAMIEMLIAAGIVNSRNRLSYSAGGVQVQVSDKAGEYANWIALLINKYERLKSNYKKHINMESCYGSVGSEYAWVNIGLDLSLGALPGLTLDSVL